MKLSMLLLASLPLLCPHSLVGQNCELIAALPPQDITITTDDVEFARKTEAWFASSELWENGSAQGFSANMLVPIQSLMAQVGYAWNQSERSRLVREFRTRWDNDETFRRQFRTARIAVNTAVVGALQACLTQKGLHVWIEPGGAPEEFMFRTVFNSPGDPLYAIVRDFQKSPNVSCEVELIRGDTIGGAGRDLLCSRTDSAGATLVLNASVSKVIDSPSRLPPIPEVAEVVTRPNHPYRIRVYTSDRRNAGTRARVYITLYGSERTLGERHYDRSGQIDHVRGGSVSYQTPVTRDLGAICRIRVRHDNTGTAPGWHVQRVVVDDYNGRSWTFPINRWLARNEGDGRISIAVGANPPPCRQ